MSTGMISRLERSRWRGGHCLSAEQKAAVAEVRLGHKEGGSCLGDHLKSGHTLSLQNRPTELAEDVIVLPCFRVRLQGAD
jgi:hypothetical protein